MSIIHIGGWKVSFDVKGNNHIQVHSIVRCYNEYINHPYVEMDEYKHIFSNCSGDEFILIMGDILRGEQR